MLTAKFKHGVLFSHKRIVLLNVVTVDTKHSRILPCLDFAIYVASIRNCMLPRWLDEILVVAICSVIRSKKRPCKCLDFGKLPTVVDILYLAL